MDDRNQRAGRNPEQHDPEGSGVGTPPGGVPGGSYGAGGGYRRGGYDRGNYDPAIDMARGTGSWSRSRADGAAGRTQPRAYGGLDEYRSSRGEAGRTSRGPGDWRQGYGAYGMTERPHNDEEGGMGAGENMFGRNAFEEEQQYDYGFGERESEGSAGPRERERGAPEQRRPERDHGVWGEEGRPNRGSQGSGWRGEQRWEERSRSEDRQGDIDWPYLEPWAVPGPYTGRGPEGYQRSAEAIRNDVCERLTRHGRLDASRIRVLVEQGEVILEGRVDSRRAKRMAEDTAESVTGVRDVQNRLRIDDSTRD